MRAASAAAGPQLLERLGVGEVLGASGRALVAQERIEADATNRLRAQPADDRLGDRLVEGDAEIDVSTSMRRGGRPIW